MKECVAKKSVFLQVFLFLSLTLVGLFHEYLSCIFALALAVYLFLRLRAEKEITLPRGSAFWFLFTLVLFYGLSPLWAQDPGMAFIGFLKFLPVFLFFLCLGREEDREKLRLSLPYFAAAISLLSYLASFLPVVGSEFFVAGRFAGVFQYPNAFAAFLLVGELELIGKEKFRFWDWGVLGILVASFLHTGSRTAFVIALAANAAVLCFTKGKKVRIAFFIGAFVVVLAFFIYVVATSSFGIFSRLLNLSLSESTFVGRLLYAQDALPVIFKNPLGLGYMGYYYTQFSFQTGVYSVTFVHNDFLQMILDVGFIPAFLFLFALGKTLISKKITLQRKILLFSLVAHAFFDFDLQFVAMFFLLVLYLDFDEKKEITLSFSQKTIPILLFLVFVVSSYVGTSLVFARFFSPAVANALYPWNTQNQIELLTEIEDVEEAAEFGEKMIKRNDAVLVAYCARARLFYSKGDFASLIEEKKKIFNLAPFRYAEYKEFSYMLINGIELYEQAGDSYSAEICKEELIALKKSVESQRERLSSLGKKIVNQPTLNLPAEVLTYIERLETKK